MKSFLTQWETEQENWPINDQIINNFKKNLEAYQIRVKENNSSIAPMGRGDATVRYA